MTPMGGTGMNTAVHTGHSLGWRLARNTTSAEAASRPSPRRSRPLGAAGPGAPGRAVDQHARPVRRSVHGTDRRRSGRTATADRYCPPSMRDTSPL
jgi:hypothetical protein